MIKLIFIVWVTVYPCGVIMAPPVFIVLHESGNAVHKHQRSAQWSFPAWRNHTNSMKYSTRTIARWFKKKIFFCKWVIKHHHYMSEHLRCILHLECKKRGCISDPLWDGICRQNSWRRAFTGVNYKPVCRRHGIFKRRWSDSTAAWGIPRPQCLSARGSFNQANIVMRTYKQIMNAHCRRGSDSPLMVSRTQGKGERW